MTDRPNQPRRLAAPFGSPRLVEAFRFALESHATQPRKGSDIPYIAHPLAVASIVLELGGDEDEAIAALLHDVVEDCGVSLEDVGKRFGARVEELVEGATDFARGEDRASLTSAERKERSLQLLAKKTDGHRRLAIADSTTRAASGSTTGPSAIKSLTASHSSGKARSATTAGSPQSSGLQEMSPRSRSSPTSSRPSP